VLSTLTDTSAHSPSLLADPIGRGKVPVTVSGIGEDETAALRDLDERVRGVPNPDGTRLEDLRRRLRFAYVEGAEEWARRNGGRGLAGDELVRVIARFGAYPPP
jgi:hypothetical protein